MDYIHMESLPVGMAVTLNGAAGCHGKLLWVWMSDRHSYKLSLTLSFPFFLCDLLPLLPIPSITPCVPLVFFIPLPHCFPILSVSYLSSLLFISFAPAHEIFFSTMAPSLEVWKGSWALFSLCELSLPKESQSCRRARRDELEFSILCCFMCWESWLYGGTVSPIRWSSARILLLLTKII